MKYYLIPVLLFSLLSFGQHYGDYHASFTVAGMSLRMSLNIVNDSTFKVSSPDEGFPEFEAEKAKFGEKEVTFELKKVALNFSGVYFPEGDSIQGKMSQSGLTWPVTFLRELQDLAIIRRYQEPTGEVPYTSEDLSIQNGEIELGATLTLPADFNENTAIVILASGSGPQNRNCELMGHKPFLVIADYLARNGVGCLRFDDRGTGESSGKYTGADLKDFASDVSACFNFLNDDPRFAANKIGLAGHSEGGMHTLIAAANNKDVDFVIQLASVGTSGREVLIEQQYLIPRQAGKTEEYARWNKNVYAGMCDYVLKYDQSQAADSLKIFLGDMYAIAPEEYKAENSKGSFIIGMNAFINNAWARQFLAFETKEYVRQLKAPILTINGEKDVQVPAVSNMEGFRSFRYKGKYKQKNMFVIAPGLNHLMQKCESCAVLEYADLEETFSEDVMSQMVLWLNTL